MLTTNVTLHEARTELQKLFGDEYQNDIWAMCCRINDLDPEELEENTFEILKEIKAKMGVERNVRSNTALVTMEEEQATMYIQKDTEQETEDESDGGYEDEEQQTQEQKLLAAWIASNYGGTVNLLDYRIFAVRCMVSIFLYLIIRVF